MTLMILINCYMSLVPNNLQRVDFFCSSVLYFLLVLLCYNVLPSCFVCLVVHVVLMTIVSLPILLRLGTLMSRINIRLIWRFWIQPVTCIKSNVLCKACVTLKPSSNVVKLIRMPHSLISLNLLMSCIIKSSRQNISSNSYNFEHTTE